MVVLQRVVIGIIALTVGTFGLAACGDDDGVDASDPLVQGIAQGLLDDEQDEEEGNRLFEADQTKAECFGIELVSEVGTDRLTELGFTLDGFLADWSADEIDSAVDGLEKCVDHRAYFRNAFLGEQSETDADCIIGEVGEDWFLDLVRAQFAAGSDQDAAEAAAEAEYQRVEDAAETCGVSFD